MSRFGGQKGLKEGKKDSRIRLDKKARYTSGSQDRHRELKQTNNEFLPLHSDSFLQQNVKAYEGEKLEGCRGLLIWLLSLFLQWFKPVYLGLKPMQRVTRDHVHWYHVRSSEMNPS